MARDITWEASQAGFPTVKITMTGFNDGVIDQYQNQIIVAGTGNVIVKSDETSATVIVNGNVILQVFDVGYCTITGNPVTDFSEFPANYGAIV